MVFGAHAVHRQVKVLFFLVGRKKKTLTQLISYALLHMTASYLQRIVHKLDRYATVKVANGINSGFLYWRNYNHSMKVMIIGNGCCRRI